MYTHENNPSTSLKMHRIQITEIENSREYGFTLEG